MDSGVPRFLPLPRVSLFTPQHPHKTANFFPGGPLFSLPLPLSLSLSLPAGAPRFRLPRGSSLSLAPGICTFLSPGFPLPRGSSLSLQLAPRFPCITANFFRLLCFLNSLSPILLLAVGVDISCVLQPPVTQKGERTNKRGRGEIKEEEGKGEMSSLVDIWTCEFARLREKRSSSDDAGSLRRPSSSAVGGGEEKEKHLAGRRAGDKAMAMRGMALSETTIWMLMDRFAPS